MGLFDSGGVCSMGPWLVYGIFWRGVAKESYAYPSLILTEAQLMI